MALSGKLKETITIFEILDLRLITSLANMKSLERLLNLCLQPS